MKAYGWVKMTQSRPDLKYFREHVLGMTQAEFGAALGETGLCRPASASTVSKWECGVFGVSSRKRAAMMVRFSRSREEINEILKLADETTSDRDAAVAGLEVRSDCLPWLDDTENGSTWDNFIGLVGVSGRFTLAN